MFHLFIYHITATGVFLGHRLGKGEIYHWYTAEEKLSAISSALVRVVWDGHYIYNFGERLSVEEVNSN